MQYPFDIVPAGPLSLPPVLLAELFAATPTFRTACGVNNKIEALAFIEVDNIDLANVGTIPVPLILITDNEELTLSLFKPGSPHGELTRGELFVSIFLPADPDIESDEQQRLAHKNLVGVLIREALNLANSLNSAPIIQQAAYFFNLTQLDRFASAAKCDPKTLRGVIADELTDIYGSVWVAHYV